MSLLDRGRALTQGQLTTVELAVAAVLLLVLTVMVVTLSPIYVFGFLGVVVGSLVFIARPDIGLLGYFTFRMVADLLWWLPINVGGLSILQVLSGGATALAAIVFFVELRKVERHPAFAPLMVYLAVMALAAIRSGDLRDALEIFAVYTSPFLIMFLVTAVFRTPQDWRKVVGLVSVVGLIPVLESVYEFGSGQMASVSLAGINRLLGGYENLHNHAHMMAVLTMLYGFWYFYLPNGWKRWAAGGAAVAALFCLYMSYVRTPVLGIAVFAVLFPILERRWIYLVLAGVGALGLLAVSETVRERFAELLLVFDTSDVTMDYFRVGSGRMGIWTVSMQQFLKRPVMDLVLGAGLGGHWEMVQAYVDQYRPVRGGTLNPHNDYLTLLYQLGPVSVICYVTMQLLVVYHALKLKRRTKDRFKQVFASYAATLAVLVFPVNMASNSFVERVTPAMLLWTMAGLLYSMVRHENELESGALAPQPAAPPVTRMRPRAPPPSLPRPPRARVEEVP